MNEELIIQKTERQPTDQMCQIIAEKKAKNTQLNFAINDYVSLKLSFSKKSNGLLLTTDFKKVTGESRPTVAMKEAWIENQLFDLKSEMNIAKENISAIKRDIEILNDELKLYELECKFKLNEENL